MISTFFGLEIGRTGVQAHQRAIEVTGHNIANASTEGYTRQTAEFVNIGPLSLNGITSVGSLGTGVNIKQVSQIRDSFIDDYIRTENGLLGQYKARYEALGNVEAIFTEPSETGLRGIMDNFWMALEDLSNQPQEPSTRFAAVKAAESMALAFRGFREELELLRSNYIDEIENTVTTINNLAGNIAYLNNEIVSYETAGNNANDIRDERGRLIDELSELVDIKVTNTSRLTGGKIYLGNRILVDESRHNELALDQRFSEDALTVYWKSDGEIASSNSDVLDVIPGTSAEEGVTNILVKKMASHDRVESRPYKFDTKTMLANLGVESGDFWINDRRLTVDASNTTVEGFAQMLSSAGVGVSAVINDSRQLEITARDTGVANQIRLEQGSSNIWEKLGMTASITGIPTREVNDPTDSLMLDGSFVIGRVHPDNPSYVIEHQLITVQQGKTDNLYEIVDQINASVPWAKASVVEGPDNTFRLRLENSDSRDTHGLYITDRVNAHYHMPPDGVSPGYVLNRLGLLETENQMVSVQGPVVTDGQDAELMVDNQTYYSGSNLVRDVVPGMTVNVKGTGTASVRVNQTISSGRLRGLLESRDEIIPQYIDELDSLAYSIINEFNEVHYEGFGADGSNHRLMFASHNDREVFPSHYKAAAFFELSDDLKADPQRIAVRGLDQDFLALTGEYRPLDQGDNSTVLAMSDLKNKTVYKGGVNFTSAVGNIFSGLGMEKRETKRYTDGKDMLLVNLNDQQRAVSGVSLDEEMTNLVKFQHGYAASARFISVVNEMLETLINRLG